MCLSEIDLSPFLSESPPAPHDVWMEVSVSNNSDQTDVTVFKAHRLLLSSLGPGPGQSPISLSGSLTLKSQGQKSRKGQRNIFCHTLNYLSPKACAR